MSLDWSPFGGNPVPGDPGQVRALAQSFRSFVGAVHQQNSLLMDVHNGVGGIWTSPAGRVFSPHLGQLPGQLTKLHTSYHDAADALDAYWPELQGAQTLATTALAKVHAAIQAQQAAQAAQAQDSQAFQAHQAELQQQAKHQADHTGLAVSLQLASYSPSPAVVAQTTQANQAYQAAMNLKDQAVDQAQGAARRLAARLDSASRAGIQNPHHGFSLGSIIHGVESWWDHHAETIETVAASALGPAGLLLTSDGRAMLKHAMEAMNPVFEVVSGVCGVVSFGLAIVGFIPGIGEVADALNEAVTLVQTGADAGMLIDGKLEGNEGEIKEAEENLVGDALGLATGGEARLLDGGDKLVSDAQKLDEATEALDNLGKDANKAHAAADDAFSRADHAGDIASKTESEAEAARAEGDIGKANMLDDTAATMRNTQNAFLDDASKANATQLSKLGDMGNQTGKIQRLTQQVNDHDASLAGRLKTFVGNDSRNDLEEARGLKGYVKDGWGKMRSDENLGKGVGDWAKSYFGAGGNRALQAVRVTNYALHGGEVAHSGSELPHDIHDIREGMGGIESDLGL